MVFPLLLSDLRNQDMLRETEASVGKGPVSSFLSQHFESRLCGVFLMVQSDTSCPELGRLHRPRAQSYTMAPPQWPVLSGPQIAHIFCQTGPYI